MKAFVSLLLGVLFMLPFLTACEKGHYTEDRQYVVYFSHDPRTLNVVLQPEGYERP
jgi:hypothetical protein